MLRLLQRFAFIVVTCVAVVFVPLPAPADTPNIVVILADDLGYGDLSCNNPERGKIHTPNLDRLAAAGMRFTDAHSSSGVCSPSRYTLLTGRYHWRTRLQKGIVGDFEAPLIAPDRLTLASLAKQRGYRTACVGKWHLGWNWPIGPGKEQYFRRLKKTDDPPTPKHLEAWKETFSQPIAGGPTTRGFDEYFGTDVPNWPPYCFIDNDRTRGIPTEFLPLALLAPNQASLAGPALPGWKLEPILPALAARATSFIADAAESKRPFCLYMPLTTPHTPIAVNERWRGKSGLNDYADLVLETDGVVGQVLDALEKSGVADNTLVLFTADNGCAPYIGIDALHQKGHYPSGPLRGYKADAWEGGHRVPFLVRWPGHVRPDSVCPHLVHHADVLATLAAIVGVQLPEGAGEDSFSLMPLLAGATSPVRQVAVSQAANGMSAIRQGQWKLIFGPGSGGWSKGGDEQPAQLYDLANDLGETDNLYARRPDLVAELTSLMEQVVSAGRSTPGAPQPNDVRVNWKQFLTARAP